MDTISFDDFLKVELRVGRVLSAEPFAQARKPAYILHVDFGPELGVRKSSAQITVHYTPEELVGRLARTGDHELTVYAPTWKGSDDYDAAEPERAAALTTRALRLDTYAGELTTCAALWRRDSLT